jgi:alginate biosynthesis protein AlgX
MLKRFAIASLAAMLCIAANAQDDVDDQRTDNDVPPDDIAAPSDAPQYRVKPCCDLCPRAADRASYTQSKYFQDNAVLVQGQKGWLFRTDMDLISHIDVSDASLEGMKHLVDALHRAGTELVLVYQPPRGLIDVDKLTEAERRNYDFAAAKQSYIAAMARLRTTGAIVPPYEKLVGEGKNYDYYFRRDHHWTPSGSERTAQIVAATVKSLPVYAKVPRKEFKTHVNGLISKPGSIQKIAQQICGGSYSMQFVPSYATEPAGGGGADSLLGDDATPEVVLVGTSNSDDRGGYNFGGYLEQYLNTDVLNVAITGGSFEGSLLHYLPTDGFQKHPPKIMIWEMPYQDFPGTAVSPHRIFRQAVALASNGCSAKSPIIDRTVQLHAGNNEVLFNGGGHIMQVKGREHLVDLQFTDPGYKELHTTLWYMNGMRERLQLRFKQYVDNKGRFAFELRNDRDDYANATFMGATVDLDSEPSKPLSVTAKLCTVDVAQAGAPIPVENPDNIGGPPEAHPPAKAAPEKVKPPAELHFGPPAKPSTKSPKPKAAKPATTAPKSATTAKPKKPATSAKPAPPPSKPVTKFDDQNPPPSNQNTINQSPDWNVSRPK